MAVFSGTSTTSSPFSTEKAGDVAAAASEREARARRRSAAVEIGGRIVPDGLSALGRLGETMGRADGEKKTRDEGERQVSGGRREEQRGGQPTLCFEKRDDWREEQRGERSRVEEGMRETKRGKEKEEREG